MLTRWYKKAIAGCDISTIPSTGLGTNFWSQYKGSAFKIATFSRWLVVISGPHAFDEFRQAADDELSLMKALEVVCWIIILRIKSSNEMADSRY